MSKIIRILCVIGIPVLLCCFLIAPISKPTYTNKAVAVVLDDEAQTYNDQLVPMGRQFVQSMFKNNPDNGYDFVITNDADAKTGLKDNTYLAALFIPKNFTKNILSFRDITSVQTASVVISYSDTALNSDKTLIAATAQNAVSDFSKTVTKQFISTTISTFSGALGKTQSGLAKLAAASKKLKSAGKQVAAAGQKIKNANTKMNTSTKQLSAGASRFPSQKEIDQLTDYYATVGKFLQTTVQFSSKVETTICGMAPTSQNCTDAKQFSAYATTMANSYQDVNAKTTKLLNQFPGLKTNLTELSNGITKLTKGTDQYVDGVTQYVNGVNQLTNGVNQFNQQFKDSVGGSVPTSSDEVDKLATAISVPIASTMLGKIFPENNNYNYPEIVFLIIFLLWITAALSIFSLKQTIHKYIIPFTTPILSSVGIFIVLNNLLHCGLAVLGFTLVTAITFTFVIKTLDVLFAKGGAALITTFMAICIMIDEFIFNKQQSFISFFMSVLRPAYDGFNNLLFLHKSIVGGPLVLSIFTVLACLVIIIVKEKHK